MQLQPCHQCRAIDNRNAIACYKCGAEFDVPAAPELVTVSAAPELDPVPALPTSLPLPAASKRARVPAASKRVRRPAASKSALASAAPELEGAPAAPVLESVPAPTPEDEIERPSEGGSAIERAILSRSPAVVGVFRHGLGREVTDPQDQTAGVADWEATSLSSNLAQFPVEPPTMDETVAAKSVENFDPAQSTIEPQPMNETVAFESVHGPELAHAVVKPQPIDQTAAPERGQYPVLLLSAVEPRPIDETLESEWAVAETGARRARRFALTTLMLAAVAFAGYYYFDRPAQQLAPAQSEPLPAPSSADG